MRGSYAIRVADGAMLLTVSSRDAGLARPNKSSGGASWFRACAQVRSAIRVDLC